MKVSVEIGIFPLNKFTFEIPNYEMIWSMETQLQLVLNPTFMENKVTRHRRWLIYAFGSISRN